MFQREQLDLYFLIFGNSDAPSRRHAASISQRLGRLAIAWIILPKGDDLRLWKAGITAVSHYNMNASGSLYGLANRQHLDPVAGGRLLQGRELPRPSFFGGFQYHDFLHLGCL
jgi:hypothetical protein